MAHIDVERILGTGRTAVVKRIVQHSDVSRERHPVLHDVMDTPRYVDLIIRAAVEAVEVFLPEGYITVGRSVELVHTAPTSLGMEVNVKATLVRVEGSHLFFDISVWDELGETAHGHHERVVTRIEHMRQRFKERRDQMIRRKMM
ncbi:MAG: thioesterase [Negativicutes bacterium]|nr:thioesterase [Negativicutes bacterium]